MGKGRDLPFLRFRSLFPPGKETGTLGKVSRSATRFSNPSELVLLKILSSEDEASVTEETVDERNLKE